MNDFTAKNPERSATTPTVNLQGQHPTKPWEVEIDVTLNSAGPPAQFQIQTCLPVNSNGDIVFRNNGRPGFNLTFRLYDNTSEGGYAFPQGANETDAVWSIVGENGCPSEGAWEVFPKSNIRVEDNGATLVVFNPNSGPTPQGNFRYTLNLTRAGATSYTALDPGGSNQNGSTLG